MIARPDGSDVTVLASPEGTNSPLPGTGNEVTWSPDGKQIASGSEDLTAQVWLAP